MKLKSLFPIIVLLACTTLSGCTNPYGIEEYPSGYDYIVGDDYSDLVKITFKYGNIESKIGTVHKTWGVQRNTSIGYGLEPKYPSSDYMSGWALYGLNLTFTTDNDITLSTYVFKSDTTLYVKYYESAQEIRFCIPNGPTNKGSGRMFSQNNIFGNTEIYSLPTLSDEKITSDWGDFELINSLSPWVTQWGWTQIDGWYYDENLTQEITLPFRLSHNGDELRWWIKCS